MKTVFAVLYAIVIGVLSGCGGSGSEPPALTPVTSIPGTGEKTAFFDRYPEERITFFDLESGRPIVYYLNLTDEEAIGKFMEQFPGYEIEL